jgi:Zn-finger nucleic acid-binding protein
MLFDGAAFCPQCGAARARGAVRDAAPTACPACRGPMHWVAVGDLDLLECQQCDGTWIEAAAFEQLCANRASQAAVLQQPAGRPAAPASAPPRYRPCLRCGKLMNRMNFGRMSGALIDVCRGHGTFLDRGELHQVVRFIQDGGLDRARRAEVEELKEEQRRLRGLERERARTAPPVEHGTWAWNERWFREFMRALMEK